MRQYFLDKLTSIALCRSSAVKLKVYMKCKLFTKFFLTDKIAGRYEKVGNFQVALERRQDGEKGNFITGLTHDF